MDAYGYSGRAACCTEGRQLYGLHNPPGRYSGKQCLVRFPHSEKFEIEYLHPRDLGLTKTQKGYTHGS